MNLSHILDWKLLPGSHDFPGPDGGTCINEAAIVAAGFTYRRVKSWRDCPPCFSPVISVALITLNDRMNDDHRDALLPFVTRLAGSRDVWLVERARALVFGASEPIQPFALQPLAYEFRRDVSKVCPNDYEDLCALVARLIHMITLLSSSESYTPSLLHSLNLALSLGNQAEPILPSLTASRLNASKAKVAA